MELQELVEERDRLNQKRKQYITERNELNKKIAVAFAKLHALESQIRRASQAGVGKRVKAVRV